MTTNLPPLLVVPWRDPDLDGTGYDPRSGYVERFWLPVLGPTATWLMRRLAAEFDEHPDGFSLDTVDAARSIGIGTRGGRNGPFPRSINRCARFGLVHTQDHDILAARTLMPPLDRGQVGGLPGDLRRAHREWAAQRTARNAHPATDQHAARLARSLLDVGASPADVVEQLERWHFDGDAAQRALTRAVDATPQPA